MTASIAIFILFFYPLPSVIAATRAVEHSGAILMINRLLGWTVLGWVGALNLGLRGEIRAAAAYR